MKRTLFDKLGDFVLGKGFYIVLFLCVTTIGISGYYLIRSAAAPAPSEPTTGSPTVVLPDPAPTAPKRSEPPAVKTPAPPAPPKEKPEEPAQSTVQPAAAPAVYTWPVKGEILRGYSLEVLAYDETMGDWRTHSGVDIAAEEGIKVLCISDGTVADVYRDDLMGITVVVQHSEGVTSTYCNLAENPVVSVGDKVETGTVLGVVGNTAIAESGCASHLHLEMTQDGMSVDPANFLPELP